MTNFVSAKKHENFVTQGTDENGPAGKDGLRPYENESRHSA